MTPEEWHQVKALLQTVLEQPPPARSSYLEEHCAGASELRREVEELLSFEEQDQAGLALPISKWKTAVAEPDPPPEAIPDRAGP